VAFVPEQTGALATVTVGNATIVNTTVPLAVFVQLGTPLEDTLTKE
jgi:hypothetical protein